jgi:hypothetical protein
MSDAVFDATVVRYTNKGLTDDAKRVGAAAGIKLLQVFLQSDRKLRYNPKLKGEYQKETGSQSDLIKAFYQFLDSPRGVFVKTNQLRKAPYARARECNWPGHDDHLLAAAIDAAEVTIYYTEHRHAVCVAAVRRRFGFGFHLVPFAPELVAG